MQPQIEYAVLAHGYAVAEPAKAGDAAVWCPNPETSNGKWAVTYSDEDKNWSDLLHYMETFALCGCNRHNHV